MHARRGCFHPLRSSMAFSFSDTDVQRMASVFGVDPVRDGTVTRFELAHPDSGRHLTVELTRIRDLPDALTSDSPLYLVSVYAPSSFLQLQGCTGFIASQELGEVIFFARQGGVTNGLVIEREAACSLYANVANRLLSTDFTQLPSELVMSSVALSMSETLFNDFDGS